MANPVASHTFDFFKIYLSTRTGGVPGSGVWTNPVTIFDGVLRPTFETGGTFSAGALGPADPHNGIVTQAKNGLAFLGNGEPTVPLQINADLSLGYWDTSQGAFFFGGVYYLLVQDSNTIKMIKSSDAGATWTGADSANGPEGAGSDGSLASIQRVNNIVYVFATTDGFGDTHWAIWGFDLTTGLWSASFAPITIGNFGVFSQKRGWVNTLFKFPNGDFAIIYQQGNNQLVYRLWDGATWGAPVNIDTAPSAYANSVIDPSFGNVHVFTYNGGSAIGLQVNYFSISHPGSVVTPGPTIPAVVGAGGDGVGHCSIQNGTIFVPRDDTADFDNSVWVATLPVTAFFKEELPVPPGETGVISLASIANGGNGAYLAGDTGFIDGGIVLQPYIVQAVGNNGILAYALNASGVNYVPGNQFTVNGGGVLATGQILAVNGPGGVTDFVLLNLGQGYSVAAGVATTATSGTGTGLKIDINSLFNGVTHLTLPNGTPPGSGYSIANNVTTTNGGSQPGVGTGLTVNILAVKGKTPSCAYMMFPNGYTFTISILCPIAPVTATVGVLYTSDAPQVTGGKGPFTFTLLSGPPWMTIDPLTGIVSGVPTVVGSFTYTIKVTDSLGATATVTAPCPLSVSSGATPPPPPPFCIINPTPGTGPTAVVYNEPTELQGS